MPKSASIEKCRSYPGTGQTKVTFSSCDQPAADSGAPKSSRYARTSHISVRLELPPQTTCSGLDPEQLGEDLPKLGQPLEPAVVAHVRTGPVRVVVGSPSRRVGEVELRAGRLAAGQVEREAPSLERGILLPLLVQERGEVGLAQVGQRGAG